MAATMLHTVAVLCLLAPACVSFQTQKYSPKASASVGVMNKAGVTRYRAEKIKKSHSSEGFYWPGPGSSEGSKYRGAVDLSDNISWGWHHPNGVYTTIPVGAPLIDDSLNVYLGTDDAIRKFSVIGDLIWSYAPRGQLACAPSLFQHSTRRAATPSLEDWEVEAELRPSRVGPSLRALAEIKAGDLIKARPGEWGGGNGVEYYKSGDVGEITNIITDSDGTRKAMIRWARTRHNSATRLATLGNKFLRMKASRTRTVKMLLGTTTSGYVFALNVESGEELWATQPCNMISGVKGSVSGKGGIVVAATDRCVDRYCYKYRRDTNPLLPGNSVVRGLSAHDGSDVWQFKPRSPVWNFVPQYGKDGDTVMFQDGEGSAYCLDLLTGTLLWQRDGHMGTYTQAHAVYFAPFDILYTMGVYEYTGKPCNPFVPGGIQAWCGTGPGSPGWIRALNGSSGTLRWEKDSRLPPASASLAQMFDVKHTRLIVAFGHNCQYSAASAIWGLQPEDGGARWQREGPTLWSGQCAGDKEAGDIRRALGGRAACQPGSWSTPVADSYGDVYIGNQVGELQRWGTPTNARGDHKVELLSTLNTGVAFQDDAIAFAPGVMAVSTCTSLIVFATRADEPAISSENWTLPLGPAEY